ncbi:MAG TPA: hypothetical protein VIM73_19380 [Polyangiaceae bacterium]
MEDLETNQSGLRQGEPALRCRCDSPIRRRAAALGPPHVLCEDCQRRVRTTIRCFFSSQRFGWHLASRVEELEQEFYEKQVLKPDAFRNFDRTRREFGPYLSGAVRRFCRKKIGVHFGPAHEVLAAGSLDASPDAAAPSAGRRAFNLVWVQERLESALALAEQGWHDRRPPFAALVSFLFEDRADRTSLSSAYALSPDHLRVKLYRVRVVWMEALRTVIGSTREGRKALRAHDALRDQSKSERADGKHWLLREIHDLLSILLDESEG